MTLPRKAKGERPYFFDDPAVDRVIAMVMGLAGEVAVMRDRLDTIERLLEQRGLLARRDIETFVADTRVTDERAAWREAFLGEVLRIVDIEREALSTGDTASYDDAIANVTDTAAPRRRSRTARKRSAASR